MISLTYKPLQVGLTLTSLAVLAGCQAGEVADTVADDSAEPVTAEATEEVTETEEAAETEEVAEVESDASFTDGTYEATGGYQSPNGAETVVVSLTIAGGVVSDVVVTPQATNATSTRYQGQFAGGIAEEIVGVPVAELDVSRVAGSSLTGGGFNAALEQIRTQARAG